MRKLQLLALLVTLSLFTPARAQAAEWSMLGGRTLDVFDTGIRAGVGWPDFHAAYHLPITKSFELAPKLAFFYGSPLVKGCCTFGNTIGTELRTVIYSQGDLHLALWNELSLILDYIGQFDVGLVLGAGVRGDYAVSSKVNALFSFDVPVDLLFTNGTYAVIPILFGGGVEYVPEGPFMLWATLKMGPGIIAVSGGSTVDFALIGQAGVGFKF
jgi:hypothetical protein